MTEQEFSSLFQDEEEALLGELGQTLRGTPSLELPSDFARQTAQAAEERFQRLSAFNKLAVRMEPVLGAPVASSRAFPFALGLLGCTIVGGMLGQQAVGQLGLGLLTMVILWKLVSSFALPSTGPARRLSWPAAGLGFFYLLPLLSAAMTAIFCGGLVSALSLFSINFKVASWNTVLLAPAAGLGVFFYLLSALFPTWRALQRQAVGRPLWMFGVQGFHSIWFGTLASALIVLSGPKTSHFWVWVPLLLVTAWVSWMLGSRSTLEDEGRPALWKALNKTGRSLLLGGLPVGAVLVGSYQAALTRHIDEPKVYESTLLEVSTWVKEQSEIPVEQNGWSLLRAAMTSREKKRPELAEQLKAGGILYEPHYDEHFWQTTDARGKWERARLDFLKALPTMEAALARPQFSYVSTQGFKMQALVPNFLLARAASQGLTGLARDAIKRHQAEEALGYQLTNLSWSGCFRRGSLISLMIGVAQESIAIENVERWVFETHPGLEQLRRMQSGLRAARFDRSELQEAMLREIYMVDRAFTELLENNPEAVSHLDTSSGQGGWQFLIKILPASYWRSEHKAYLNLMLADQDNRKELGRPRETDPAEMLPFSFAARQLAPMTHKAQTNFMICLTRFFALDTVVALEIYQREHGHYPDSLSQLVPEYLPELPKDAVSPNLWAHKPALHYLRTQKGYRLSSQSPLYEEVKYKNHQVFGPDGEYKLEMLSGP